MIADVNLHVQNNAFSFFICVLSLYPVLFVALYRVLFFNLHYYYYFPILPIFLNAGQPTRSCI